MIHTKKRHHAIPQIIVDLPAVFGDHTSHAHIIAVEGVDNIIWKARS